MWYDSCIHESWRSAPNPGTFHLAGKGTSATSWLTTWLYESRSAQGYEVECQRRQKGGLTTNHSYPYNGMYVKGTCQARNRVGRPGHWHRCWHTCSAEHCHEPWYCQLSPRPSGDRITPTMFHFSAYLEHQCHCRRPSIYTGHCEGVAIAHLLH